MLHLRLALKVRKESKVSRVAKDRLAAQERSVSKVSKASKECRASKATKVTRGRREIQEKPVAHQGRRVPLEQMVPRDRLEK